MITSNGINITGYQNWKFIKFEETRKTYLRVYFAIGCHQSGSIMITHINYEDPQFLFIDAVTD